MPDYSELKEVLIHVLSGLTYMSNDIIKKSSTYLEEVEFLDSNSVEPVTKKIKTLFQRANINLTQFGVTFDTAVENHKKEQEAEKAKAVNTPVKPKSKLSVKKNEGSKTPEVLLVNDGNITDEPRLQQVSLVNDGVGGKITDEPRLQHPLAPDGSSESSDLSLQGTVIKEEKGTFGSDNESSDPFAMLDSSAFDENSMENENEVKSDLESSNFNFVNVDMNGDDLEIEMEENHKDAENELTDSGGETVENIEIEETMKADVGSEQMLPEKSKVRYELAYKFFRKWLDGKNFSITERSLFAYFMARSATLKSPASLWSEYSMLRATINIYDGIDISKFTRLIPFLKKKNVGYRPKKSRVFTREQLFKFLKEAPDEVYLMMKVVMITGIAGTCRNQELAYMRRDSIKDHGAAIFITIPSSKTHNPRTFIIANHHNEIDFLAIFRKYQNILPEDPTSNRFFHSYHNGKCSKQFVGIHTMAKVPAKIARYLNLPEPEMYTGRAFRSTSPTLLWHSN